MKTADIIELSEWVVATFNLKGDYISNKKLQKLLYYIQAWHLVYSDKLIFEDKPQAWVHGPVYEKVYHHFKEFGFDPLKVSQKKIELASSQSLSKILDISKQQEELTHTVLLKYAPLTAYQLELLTHSEKPWKEQRNGLSEFDRSSNPISFKTMKNYYSSLVK